MASASRPRISEKFGPKTALRTYYEMVYYPLRIAIRSADTDRLYRGTFDSLDVFLGHPPRLSDLTDETVARYIAWYASGGRSARTANNHRHRLLALWRFCCRKGHLKIWPDVQALPELKRAPSSWSIEQLSAIVSAAYTTPQRHARKYLAAIPFRVFWPALLLTLYDSALRIRSCMLLRWDDINTSDKTWVLHVRAETMKDREDLIVRLSDQTTAALKELRKHKSGELVFPWTIKNQSLWYFYKTILKRAGLPHGRGDMFHRIRKTAATLAEVHIGAGTAMKLLGHASQRTTDAHYLDQSKLPQMNIAAALPRPVIGGGK